MLMAVVSLFAACSDDDNYNSKSDVTLEFAQTELTVKESSGIVNIPVKVSGARNGEVAFTVNAKEVGDNPAKEDEHFMITDKSLKLKVDTLKDGVVNVEVKMVDNEEINETRSFELDITSVNGATLGEHKSVLVTIRDNESLFYEKFFGTWTLSAKDADGAPLTCDITISGETDEENPDYNNVLTAEAPGLFNVGVELDCAWHFRYTYDERTQIGTLGFICGEMIASFNNTYEWAWATDNGQSLTFDDLVTGWRIEDGHIPTTINFPPSRNLWLYQYAYQPQAGWWDRLSEITLTRK